MTLATPAVEDERAPAPAPAAHPPAPGGAWARWVVGLAAGGFIVLYVGVALARVRSPIELEWMEGGVVDHVRQVMAGHQLYQRPSLHFVPYIYTPLYYYVGAAASWVGGVGFVPLRVLSILSSLGAFAAVAALVVSETRDRWAGLVAAGLFAACYHLGGTWFDVARVDSLFLALLFTAIWMARRSATTRAAAATAAVMTLAFLTKQTALLPALSLVPIYLWRGRRPAVAYVGGLALGIGGSTLLLDAISSGWYSRYVFGLPTGHELVPGKYLGFWTQDLWPVALAAAIGLVGIGVAWRRSTAERPAIGFYLAVMVGLVASAYSSRLHSGGFDNVLLPAYGGIAVLFGIGVHHLLGARPA
ncbi:MAG: hypothetical protein JWN46_1395, partial [Acidimicrobiales bacterium]|nr:hypothetical protein [Acidimicrobiales bacterium]